MKANRKTAYYLQGFYSPDCDDPGIREACGRKMLYENMPVFIDDNLLIAGRLNIGLQNEIVSNQVSSHHYNQENIDAFLLQDDIDEKSKEIIRNQIDEFKKTCLFEFRHTLANEEELLVEESGAARAQGYNGHFGYDFGFILNNGFEKVKSIIQKYAEEYQGNQNNKENQTKKNQIVNKKTDRKSDFYQALLITVEGMQQYIRRHAEKAESLIGAGQYDDNEFKTLSAVCRNIADNKPSSFREAVQLQWFLMMFTDYDSFGRYDQYMRCFYEDGINTGIAGNKHTTREEAKDIFKAMLLRVDECGAILNMTIGGITPTGEDAVNDLTYLILEATRELKLKGPNLCLRINKFNTEKLWNEAGKSLSTGQALPALYNDEVFINMLKNNGITEEDANNYTLAGCSQAVIPGKSNFNCDVGLYVPAKMLDLALHNGFDTRTGKQVGPKTGNPASFTSYDQFYTAYREQMKYCVDKGTALNDQDVRARSNMFSTVRTLLIPECIKKGISVMQGGATYNGIQGEVIGITNTANSLTAIKQLVFDEKKITFNELIRALDTNFVGYENIRSMLLKVPKFGNDTEEPDKIRSEITRDIYSELLSHEAEHGGVHWPGEVIFSYHLSEGIYVGALPDGRYAYTVLADSAGPTQGTDTNGLTSVLNSAAKLPFDLLCTSINLNLKFPKTTWEENKQKILLALQTYFKTGGSQLQINVTDTKLLKDAIKNPQNHKNLIVRVGGFSAYFIHLEKDLQLEIISRTEAMI